MATRQSKKIQSTIEEVLSNESDEQLCASFNLAGHESPWVQVVRGAVNLFWPFKDEPEHKLASLTLPRLPGWELSEWEPMVYATFRLDETPATDLAALVEALFTVLYQCEKGYRLQTRVYAIQTDQIPELVPITREEDYHTHHIGHYGAGSQFMGFVVATLPEPLPEDWEKHKRWYAVLHTFDPEGNHLKTEHWFAGTTADGEREVIKRAQEELARMIERLGKIAYGNVAVKLFSTAIDGQVFGLVDGSYEDEETGEFYVVAELKPNDLAFHSPWDGDYDT